MFTFATVMLDYFASLSSIPFRRVDEGPEKKVLSHLAKAGAFLVSCLAILGVTGRILCFYISVVYNRGISRCHDTFFQLSHHRFNREFLASCDNSLSANLHVDERANWAQLFKASIA